MADFFEAGPYQTMEQIEGPVCTIHRPTTLGQDGRRHPILLWGNSLALGPEMYRALLKHFASHGFVVAATDTTREGTGANGQALLACLGYLETQNATAGSVYENKLNVYRVGAAGHSAGGGAVIMAGRDPRIVVTAPIQPALATLHGYVPGAAGQQQGPMFLTSGDNDMVIAPTTPPAIFAAVNTPAIWAEQIGSGHNDPLFDAPLYRRPVTAWLGLAYHAGQQCPRVVLRSVLRALHQCLLASAAEERHLNAGGPTGGDGARGSLRGATPNFSGEGMVVSHAGAEALVSFVPTAPGPPHAAPRARRIRPRMASVSAMRQSVGAPTRRRVSSARRASVSASASRPSARRMAAS